MLLAIVKEELFFLLLLVEMLMEILKGLKHNVICGSTQSYKLNLSISGVSEKSDRLLLYNNIIMYLITESYR